MFVKQRFEQPQFFHSDQECPISNFPVPTNAMNKDTDIGQLGSETRIAWNLARFILLRL